MRLARAKPIKCKMHLFMPALIKKVLHVNGMRSTEAYCDARQ